MEKNILVALLSSLGEFSGLALFLWYVYKGLKGEIQSLRTIIDIQKQTLDAMERRIGETEKIKDLYRGLIQDWPEDFSKQLDIIKSLRDEVIHDLKEANERKDEKLKELTQDRLEGLNELENLLKELPVLKDNLQTLVQTQSSIESKLGLLDMFQPWKPLGRLMNELERRAEESNYGKEVKLLQSTGNHD
jgi:DNA repair ATPase RecN